MKKKEYPIIERFSQAIENGLVGWYFIVDNVKHGPFNTKKETMDIYDKYVLDRSKNDNTSSV